MIYFDYNATTPLFPAVKNAVTAALDVFGNPSSVHGIGREARKLVEGVRAKIANSLNCTPASVVFTGSGTESNNSVLRAFEPSEVLISSIEHLSIINIYPEANQIRCRPDGLIDLEDLEQRLASGRHRVVSVMMANNETGVIQLIPEVVRLARTYGCLVHCDAVQCYGKMPIDFTALDLDFMTISSHKIGGPKGTAALIMKPAHQLASFMRGAGQERRRRAGTENVMCIAGFGAAVDEIFKVNWERIHLLRKELEAGVLNLGLEIVSQEYARTPNTSMIAFADAKQGSIALMYDLSGVAVSTGAACSSGKVDRSHVLKAMGYPELPVIRASLGWQTTQKEIEQFLAVTERIVTRNHKEVA